MTAVISPVTPAALMTGPSVVPLFSAWRQSIRSASQ